MGIQLLKKEWNEFLQDYIERYVIDSEDDAALLPQCAPGSRARIADNSSVIYAVNASGEWKAVPSGGGGGSSGRVVVSTDLSGLADKWYTETYENGDVVKYTWKEDAEGRIIEIVGDDGSVQTATYGG